MKVLLKKDVRNVGRKGEVKNVAEGYFRNFLLPQSLAVPVTEGLAHTLETEGKQKEEHKQKVHGAIGALAEELAKTPITIKGKMDETGKLFGSVNVRTIEDELKKKKIDISKLHGTVVLGEHLKEKGSHRVEIRFPGGEKVHCTIVIEKL